MRHTALQNRLDMRHVQAHAAHSEHVARGLNASMSCDVHMFCCLWPCDVRAGGMLGVPTGLVGGSMPHAHFRDSCTTRLALV